MSLGWFRASTNLILLHERLYFVTRMTCGVVMIIVLQYRYTIYTTKSSNNAPWYGLSAKGVAYRVLVFSLNVSKPADLAFSFVSIVHTIKSQFASKLAVGFQNILRKNFVPVVSLVSPRETCLVIEGGAKPACNQGCLLVSNPVRYIIYGQTKLVA